MIDDHYWMGMEYVFVGLLAAFGAHVPVFAWMRRRHASWGLSRLVLLQACVAIISLLALRVLEPHPLVFILAPANATAAVYAIAAWLDRATHEGG